MNENDGVECYQWPQTRLNTGRKKYNTRNARVEKYMV